MGEIFPNLVKGIIVHIQEAIVKLMKTKDEKTFVNKSVKKDLTYAKNKHVKTRVVILILRK